MSFPSDSADATASRLIHSTHYDAVVIVSFGGPECQLDVLPFLENVLRGRNVPRERMLEVAEHYRHCGGRSPINDQNRMLLKALQAELSAHGPDIPVYWGNRNWHPMLADTVRQMADDGIRKAIAFVTSAYSSYSGCRQYRENIAAACEPLGVRAPSIDKIRVFFNHPGFVGPMADRLTRSLEHFEADVRNTIPVLFTAHSIPTSMSQSCRYEAQLTEASRLVAETAGVANWRLVYQSRSGPPSQPWLEPDVCDAVRELAALGNKRVAIVPIGFISDHMEVVYDLDTEAADVCKSLGIDMVRTPTVGTDPIFIRMIRDLVAERVWNLDTRPAMGLLPANHDVCPLDCCPAGQRPRGGSEPIAEQT